MRLFRYFIGGGVSAQDTRCYNPEFVGDTADEPRKCETIDPNAKKTIIIDDKFGSPALLSNLGNGSYAYTNFIVNTDLVLDKQSSFYNCKFLVKEGVQITVGTGRKAEFAFCHLYACEKMWKGIRVGLNSTLGFHYNIIEDAQYAIYSDTNSSLYLNSNEFKRNYIGVYLRSNAIQTVNVSAKVPKLLSFANNRFISTDTRLNYPYEGQYPTPTIYKTFAGLKIQSMNLVLPNRDPKFLNKFEDVCIGILSKSSSIDISQNCRFDMMVFDGSKSKNKYYFQHEESTNSFYGLGVGIYATKSNVTIVGLGNKTSTNNLTTIESFANKAVAVNESNLDIKQCYILQKAKPINVNFEIGEEIAALWSGTSKSLIVDNITVQDEYAGSSKNQIFIGIYAPSSAYATKIEIQNSDFKTISSGSSIIIYAYKGNLPMLINNCTFDSQRKYESLFYDKSSISAVFCNYPTITKNKFSINAGHAITIFDCRKGGKIENNSAIGKSIISNPKAPNRGITLYHSPDFKICTNSLDYLGTGILFSGICTGTNLSQNSFNTHDVAMMLGTDPTDFTTTIDPQTRKANTWVEGKSITFDGVNHFDTKNNLFLIESKSKNYPLFPKKLKANNNGWFLNDNSNRTQGCFSAEPPSITPFTDGVLDEEWYETYNDVEKWEARRHVYRGIYEGVYGNTDDRLAAFYLKQYHTSVGEIERVHILMDDAYRMSSSSLAAIESLKNSERAIVDMMVELMASQANKTEWDEEALGKYELYLEKLDNVQVQIQSIESEIQTKRSNTMYAAKELNDGITPSTEYEKDDLRLNRIEMKMILENRDLTDAEVNEVEVIAHKCNKAFGSNVRRAYSMLPPCVRTDFKIGCDGEIDIFDEPTLGKKAAKKQTEVYPNPVNDVLICNHMSLVAQVKMVNSQGQVIKILNLEKGTQSFEIDVKSLPTGIYSLVLQNFDNSTAIQKIVVQH